MGAGDQYATYQALWFSGRAAHACNSRRVASRGSTTVIAVRRRVITSCSSTGLKPPSELPSRKPWGEFPWVVLPITWAIRRWSPQVPWNCSQRLAFLPNPRYIEAAPAESAPEKSQAMKLAWYLASTSCARADAIETRLPADAGTVPNGIGFSINSARAPCSRSWSGLREPERDFAA